MENRLKIGIDMDETINNLIAKLLVEYNRKYFDSLKFSDIKSYDIERYLKPECKNIWSEFCSYSFMLTLDVAEGAIETLSKLNESYEIYFVTAGYPETIAVRDAWLKIHFQFYRSDHLIVCSNKQMIRLDCLVDDYDKNLIGQKCCTVLMTKPWNEGAKCVHRIDSITQLPDILNQFVQ